MHDKESRAKKIEQLEARMNALTAKYKEVKNRLRELGDEESEEAYNLGLVEFNLFNSIDMLDEKIIAVPIQDPTYKDYYDIQELPKHIFDEMMHFFEVYKTLEHKKTTVKDLLQIPFHTVQDTC